MIRHGLKIDLAKRQTHAFASAPSQPRPAQPFTLQLASIHQHGSSRTLEEWSWHVKSLSSVWPHFIILRTLVPFTEPSLSVEHIKQQTTCPFAVTSARCVRGILKRYVWLLSMKSSGSKSSSQSEVAEKSDLKRAKLGILGTDVLELASLLALRSRTSGTSWIFCAEKSDACQVVNTSMTLQSIVWWTSSSLSVWKTPENHVI